jgi:hypothetical protein
MSLQIPIIDGIFRVIDKLIPDREAAAKMKLDTLKLQQDGEFKQIDADLQVMLAQAKINETEAASADGFRGGWRPAVGWVCVTGMGWTYIASPLLGWLSAAKGWPVPPTIDTFDLLIMLGGMLGFGGMRSFERIKGRA